MTAWSARPLLELTGVRRRGGVRGAVLVLAGATKDDLRRASALAAFFTLATEPPVGSTGGHDNDPLHHGVGSVQCKAAVGELLEVWREVDVGDPLRGVEALRRHFAQDDGGEQGELGVDGPLGNPVDAAGADVNAGEPDQVVDQDRVLLAQQAAEADGAPEVLEAARGVVCGHPAPPSGDPDNIAITTMNTILGGDFVSRINMNIREDKHWSYGARSC